MWAQGTSPAVAWRGLTADADGLWATLARSSAQRQQHLRQAQRSMRGVDVGELADSLDFPAVFANTDAADAYRAQLNQMFERAQQQLAEFEGRVRGCVSQLQCGQYRPRLPHIPGPSLSVQSAWLTIYVARYHAYLSQYQAALGQTGAPKPVHPAWLQWAAVAAIIDVVAQWVSSARAIRPRTRFYGVHALWTPCPTPAVHAAALRAVCLDPLLC